MKTYYMQKDKLLTELRSCTSKTIMGETFTLISEDLKSALVDLLLQQVRDEEAEDYEPYMGWCDVKGCENESSCNGGSWRESGYWGTCYKHSDEYRQGKPQPEMKALAIERENSRDENGILLNWG